MDITQHTPTTPTAAHHVFEIHINHVLYKVDQPFLMGAELKALANIAKQNQLFLEHGGKDKPIADGDAVAMQNGQQFYDVAPGTFGRDAMHAALKQELQLLETTNKVDVTDAGGGDVVVCIHGVPLPPGWNRSHTSMLVRVPKAYPHAQLDCFLADAELRLASGAQPTNTGFVPIAGRTWLQFSWHLTRWVPGVDNLLKYVGFCRGRLQEVR